MNFNIANPKKNILICASLAESLLNFRGPLLAAIQVKGHQVHVAAPNLPVGCSLRQQLQEQGYVVHSVYMRRTGTNPVSDVCTLWQLWRLMRLIQPSIFLGYTIKPVIYGTLAAYFADVPHRFALITGLGYSFQGQANARGGVRALVQRLYGLALRRSQKVFFQNPDDQNLFRSLGLLPPDIPSCVVNGSGVDVAAFAVAPVPPVPHFLLIARLLGDKGVREYAQAAQRTRVLYPQALFSLVGWLDENPDAIAHSELDAWVQAGTINFLGRLSDVRPAIESCSVYVLPSYREGTPRTVLEAMAMGRAIITTDAPGCRETVVNGDNGFLVPVQSVDALANAMARFIIDPTLAVQMGQRSRQLAEDKYDVHKVNAVMLKQMGLG
jgi:glycosyltransferase involved in cell wall biosynthesis